MTFYEKYFGNYTEQLSRNQGIKHINTNTTSEFSVAMHNSQLNDDVHIQLQH